MKDLHLLGLMDIENRWSFLAAWGLECSPSAMTVHPDAKMCDEHLGWYVTSANNSRQC